MSFPLLLYRGYGPHFFCVGEYLPERLESVMSNGGPMDSLWHDRLYWKLRDALVFDQVNWEELKNAIDSRREGYRNVIDTVNYQSNHDHDRLLVELGKERQIFDTDAFRRVRMALIVQVTSYGIVMIWMGEEIGEYKEKTPGVAKLDWSLIEKRSDNSNAINNEQFQFYKDVIHLRRQNFALLAPNFEYIFEHMDDRILAWYRWNDTTNENDSHSNHVIIVCNWSSTNYETYDILNIPHDGQWYEWLNNDKEYHVQGSKLTIDNFLDHTARILIYQKKRADGNDRSSA